MIGGRHACTLLLALFFSTTAASADNLQGKVEKIEPFQFDVNRPADPPAPFQFDVDKPPDTPAAIRFGADTPDRPAWIPAGAVTSAEMVAVHRSFYRIATRVNPSGEVSILGKDIVALWPHSYRHWGPCKIMSVPIYGHPGNFSFFTVGDPSGPSGWVQDLGYKEKKGWAYRYWFASI
jgi:hypothetical protein